MGDERWIAHKPQYANSIEATKGAYLHAVWRKSGAFHARVRALADMQCFGHVFL